VSNDRTLPQDVINLWPEILCDIKMNVVPLNYVHTIEITFKNSKIWEIDLKKNSKNRSSDSFEEEIKSIIQQYENEIDKIDFRLDTVKIKKDISSKTKKFLKNKKL